MKRRDILNSPHLKESKLKRRKELFRKIFVFVGSIFALLVGLSLIAQLEKLNIESVKVEGSKVLDGTALEATAKDTISGKYLWLYPKSNILFYSKSGIEEKLRETFKGLENIAISLGKDRVLIIEVSERTPVYTWCGEELPEESDFGKLKCYFMDGTGFVFAEAPYFSGDVYFRFFGRLRGEEVVGGEYMPEIFPKLALFIKTLPELGLEPASLTEAGDKFELYLSAGTLPPNAPKIILDKDFDLEASAENLRAVLRSEPLATDFKKKYSSLQYIDLSYGSKVYYKFSD